MKPSTAQPDVEDVLARNAWFAGLTRSQKKVELAREVIRYVATQQISAKVICYLDEDCYTIMRRHESNTLVMQQ